MQDLVRSVFSGEEAGQGRGGQMGNYSRYEVRHRDEAFGVAIASGVGSRFVKRAILGLDAALSATEVN